MDSDEKGHSESEFYYPEEETLNQMTPINCDEVEQDRHLNNSQDFIYSLHFNDFAWLFSFHVYVCTHASK